MGSFRRGIRFVGSQDIISSFRPAFVQEKCCFDSVLLEYVLLFKQSFICRFIGLVMAIAEVSVGGSPAACAPVASAAALPAVAEAEAAAYRAEADAVVAP